MTATSSGLLVEGEDREDPVAVDDLSALVDRDQPVAVAVEGEAERSSALDDGALQECGVGGAAADVDVRAVRRVPDRVHGRAEPLEGVHGEAGAGPVGAVEHDVQSGEVRAEGGGGEVDVRGRDTAVPRDRAEAGGGRRLEQRLDRLLVPVGELPGAAEELDAVVLGRVVRRRDHGAEIELDGAQTDGPAREHAAEDDVRPGRGHSLGESRLELGPGAAGVAPDEDPPSAAPEHRRPPEPLDEGRGEELACDPTNAVSSEVPARHRRQVSDSEGCCGRDATRRERPRTELRAAPRRRRPGRTAARRARGDGRRS